jgi:hypothetical protein
MLASHPPALADIDWPVSQATGESPHTCHAHDEPSHTSSNVRWTITQSESIQRSRPAETTSASGKPSQRSAAVRRCPILAMNVSVPLGGYVCGYVDASGALTATT